MFGKAINSRTRGERWYGFITRLFAAYLLEGVQLVSHDPVLVEYAARTAGMVMPPKVFDEVTLTLGMHGFDVRREVTGEALDMPGLRLMKRSSSKAKRQTSWWWLLRLVKTIWSGLKSLVDVDTPEVTGLEHLQRRLMVAQAAEVGRVLQDGIIREHKDVDVGAILGLGYAPNTGGPLRWMDEQAFEFGYGMQLCRTLW